MILQSLKKLRITARSIQTATDPDARPTSRIKALTDGVRRQMLGHRGRAARRHGWTLLLLAGLFATPATFAADATATKSAPKGTQHSASRANKKPQWTSVRSLPNSTDNLHWSRPAQAKLSEIHRDQPGYLTAPARLGDTTDAAPLNATPARAAGPQRQVILPASFEQTAEPSVDLLEGTHSILAEPMRINAPRTGKPIRRGGVSKSTARRMSDVKLTAGQNANSAADVFDDDLLDEMLPELDERPAGRAPAGNTAPESDAFDDLPLTNDDADDVFPEPELPASDSGSSRFADDLP
ncbi:MAG: hypothetical protein KDB23_22820, partial [Planctomycetales bacterium]|nr:hypothetical protein [Planctomycetales bacterium]